MLIIMKMKVLYYHTETILRHRGVVVITTAQLDLAKPEIRFCAGSDFIHSMSEICVDEDL